MRLVFGGLAVLDLAVLVLLHLLSFVPGAAPPKWVLIPLGLGTIFLVFMVVGVTGDLSERLRRRKKTTYLEASRVINDVVYGEFAAPGWKRLMGLAVAYTVVNVALMMGLSEGGNAYQEEGRFVLKSHGQLIRELTAEEFEFHERLVFRGFTGHMGLFALVATVFFLKAYPVAKAAIPPKRAKAIPLYPLAGPLD